MVVLIATTGTAASDASTAAAAASSSSHALKLFAVPSLTAATGRLFETVEVAR
jgi:hypothetical protein